MNRMGFLKRALLVGLILCPMVLRSDSSLAQYTPLPARIVVLFDGLTLDDLHNPGLPNLRSLPKRGFVGLMNTAVAGAKTDTSAMLPLAAGFLTPGQSTDEDACEAWSETKEGGPAGTVFARRTGLDPPPHSAKFTKGVDGPNVHLAIAPLLTPSMYDPSV